MNDSDLRDAFHRLRDAESARAPRFGVAPRPRFSIWRPAIAAAMLLFIVMAISTLPIRREPEIGSIVDWKAPTDVLLRTPGSELLSTVPQIPERK